MTKSHKLPKVVVLPVEQLPPRWRLYDLVTGNTFLNKWVLR